MESEENGGGGEGEEGGGKARLTWNDGMMET